MADMPRLTNDLIQQLRGIFFAKDRSPILSAFNWLGLPLISTPSINPSVDNYYMYFKSGGGLYSLDWNGIETQLTKGSIQPLFSAYVSSDISDVTGDGTRYTIVFDSILQDANNNFNTTTGTFTAPLTGNYLLITYVRAEGLGAFTSNRIEIETSNRRYRINTMDTDNVVTSNLYNFGGSAIADMDASDVANVTIDIAGGAKTVDVGGGASNLLLTYFQGYLLI